MHRKHRGVLAALTIGLALLIVCSVSGRLVASIGLNKFIVPGATNIQVRSLSLWEQQISYQAPKSDYRWYFTVVHNLSRDGWSAPIDTRVRLRSSPDIHWRIWPVWFVYIKERVALQGDPDAAQITVRREIIVPWRRYLP